MAYTAWRPAGTVGNRIYSQQTQSTHPTVATAKVKARLKKIYISMFEVQQKCSHFRLSVDLLQMKQVWGYHFTLLACSLNAVLPFSLSVSFIQSEDSQNRWHLMKLSVFLSRFFLLSSLFYLQIKNMTCMDGWIRSSQWLFIFSYIRTPVCSTSFSLCVF